ncbi:MAG TPA: MBL fold metallo-hydrolase [Actinomycetota bacterium]|nr:MBL fold metallo-hydrolase [Actinomycetota bacterium]
MSAEVHVLFEGYVGKRTAATVGFVRDGAQLIVVDPGMVPDQAAISGPLAALGVEAEQVTDVVISHHHPDHTINVGMFPKARVHDRSVIYRGDVWEDRAAEGTHVSPAVWLIETPGHSPEDITTLVDTDDGIVAFTHLWWSADGPSEDPYASDPAALHAGRARVLDVAARIVPGHGAAFTPDDRTLR